MVKLINSHAGGRVLNFYTGTSDGVPTIGLNSIIRPKNGKPVITDLVRIDGHEQNKDLLVVLKSQLGTGDVAQIEGLHYESLHLGQEFVGGTDYRLGRILDQLINDGIVEPEPQIREGESTRR